MVVLSVADLVEVVGMVVVKVLVTDLVVDMVVDVLVDGLVDVELDLVIDEVPSVVVVAVVVVVVVLVVADEEVVRIDSIALAESVTASASSTRVPLYFSTRMQGKRSIVCSTVIPHSTGSSSFKPRTHLRVRSLIWLRN